VRVGGSSCRSLRQRPERVATLAFDCVDHLHVACSTSLCVVVHKDAAVWQLDAVTGAVVCLDDPPGEIWDAGVSQAGAPVVFTAGGGVLGSDRTIAFEGQTYSGEVNGEPILVHALRWEDGHWRGQETRLSDKGVDCALGLSVLASLREDRSWPPKDPRGAFSSRMRELPPGDALGTSLGTAASRVRAVEPDEGAWIVGEGEGGARLAWFSDAVECTWQPQLPLLFGRGGAWRVLDGPLPAGSGATRVEALDITVGANHALVSWSEGAALIELTEGSVVWRRAGLMSAMLWPPTEAASPGL
jgi:hypothetical protein